MAWRQEHGKPGHAAPLDGDKDLTWKPGGGGQAAKERAKELRKYAEQRALQKEAAREERKAEKEAAAKEAASASSAASASAEGERPICKFFELGKCNKGAKCKFRHEVAAAAPEDGDAGDAAEAFDVIAKMPADAWLHIISRLGVAGACSMAACCSALAAVVATKGVWEEKRDQLFGGGGGDTGAASSSSEAPTARHECCVSEASLRGWARAAVEPAAELALGEMTSASIVGGLGFSTHEGKMLRLWEARSGRRLGAKALKDAPLCCDVGVVGARKTEYDASGTRTVAAVGDVEGRVHLLDLEEPLDGKEQRGPFGPRGTFGAVPPMQKMCSVVVLQGSGRAGADRGGAGAGAGGTADVLAALLDEAAGEDGDDDNDAERDQYTPLAEPVVTASAYRDGLITVSAASLDGWRAADAPPGARVAHETWRGTLAFNSTEWRLTFRGRDDQLVDGELPGITDGSLIALADGGMQNGASVLYAG